MVVRWVTQKEANAFIVQFHRHHNKVVGAITCIGAFNNNDLIGVAVISRPVSRRFNYREVTEVTRLCTNGAKNACSKLYGSAARIAKEMGFKLIQTYILQSESGVSLKAAGWTIEDAPVGGKQWNGREHEIQTLFGEVEKRPKEMKKRCFKILG